MSKFDRFLDSATTIIGAIVLASIIAICVAIILAFPVMWLWNASLAQIFESVPEITFWQALWLSLLCGFLFPHNSTSKSKSK